MSQRLLTLLLIGTTLLGSLFCCCAVKAQRPESGKVAACCSHRAESSNQCPPGSDDGNEHNCPCRAEHSVTALLNSSQVLATAPLSMWLSEQGMCSVGGSPLWSLEALSMSPLDHCGRLELQAGGNAILIAHCVSRC